MSKTPGYPSYYEAPFLPTHFLSLSVLAHDLSGITSERLRLRVAGHCLRSQGPER